MAAPDDNLRELAARKEKEWRQVQELRMGSLETAYREKERELGEQRAKFQKLKEDFKFNLKLLQERDTELERYDKVLSDMKNHLVPKDAEISELKIKLDEAKMCIAGEQKRHEELQIHYQQRLREKQEEVNRFRCNKEAEINKERAELESIKRNLEHQLKVVEQELDIQRQQLSAAFDDELKKREHEFRVQVDEMSTTVLSYELKVKLLTKELEMLKESQQKCTEVVNEKDDDTRRLQKALEETQWELNDVSALKDARISELESKQHQTKLYLQRMQEEFQRKHEELDRYGREKESALVKVKEGHHERERQLQEQIMELQGKVESAEVELRRLEWGKQDLAKEKDIAIEKLQCEMSELRDKWDTQLREVSQSGVSRDLEIQALRENEFRLKAELVQSRENVDRYKKELNAAVEREAGLERAKAQLELDWQRRYDNVEHEQYERSEELVRNLTTNKKELVAALKEKEREMQQREDLIKVLSSDRDQAWATLKQHGLVVDKNIDVERYKKAPETASEQINQLQQQNENLRQVIREMRQQMEGVATDKKPTKSATDAYVINLEQQIKDLKSENRKLEKEPNLERIERKEKDDIQTAVKDNALVRLHIESLNNDIGSLRSEKVELSAQVRKQQARIQYFENLVDQLSKQPRQKQVELDQLHYELGAQERRNHAEIASLRQQVSDLQLQLAESQKEADAYYHSNLEKNSQMLALGNEVSHLKLGLAEKIPSINFGAQELMIQQLQDEIQRLRQQQKGVDHVTFETTGPSKGQSTNVTISQLQEKLRMAAKHISQLAREKQQLIEMGNRLRAELMNNGIKPPSSKPNPVQPLYQDSGSLSQKVQNKLQQLEDLQYQLVKQELAKKGASPRRFQPNFDSSGEIVKSSRTEAQGATLHPDRESSSGSTSHRTSSPAMDQHLHISLSSVGGESLQDLWKMLEDGNLSPSILTQRDLNSFRALNQEKAENSYLDRDFAVEGKRADIEKKTPIKKASPKPVRKPVLQKAKPKVRNYNSRDVTDR